MPPRSVSRKNQSSRSSGNRPARRGRQSRQPGPTSRNSATARVGATAVADLRYQTPLFPPRVEKRLMYSEVGLVIAATNPNAQTYFFSANGLFDPNITGTGHQPMGFDQMMLFFEQYTVVSSKCTMQCINSSGAGVYANVGLYLSPDLTQLTIPNRLLECGQISWKTLKPIGINGSSASLNLDCNIPTYFGRNRNKRALLDDTNLFGTVAANPSEQVYYGLVVFDPTIANNTDVTFTVVLEYQVMFWEPRKAVESFSSSAAPSLAALRAHEALHRDHVQQKANSAHAVLKPVPENNPAPNVVEIKEARPSKTVSFRCPSDDEHDEYESVPSSEKSPFGPIAPSGSLLTRVQFHDGIASQPLMQILATEGLIQRERCFPI